MLICLSPFELNLDSEALFLKQTCYESPSVIFQCPRSVRTFRVHCIQAYDQRVMMLCCERCSVFWLAIVILFTRADSQSIPSCHALVNQQLPPNAFCHNLLQVCIEMTAEMTCHSNSFIYWNSSVDFVLGKNVCIEALLKWNWTTNCKPVGQSTLQKGVIPKYKINGILFLWGIYDWLITVSMTRCLLEIIEPQNAQSCHNILVWPIL